MKKIRSSYYPKCNSFYKLSLRTSGLDGTLYIDEEKQELYFVMRFFKRKSFLVQLDDIVSVKTCTINYIFPFGVLIRLKNGEEYMVGHIFNKKLAKFIIKYTNKTLHL